LFRDTPESGLFHLLIHKYTNLQISFTKFNIMLNTINLE
jgi:hypothetical protein